MGIQGAESGKENLWTVDQTSKLTPVGLLAHLWTWGGGGPHTDSAACFIQQIHRDTYCPVDTGMGPHSWGSLSRRETDNEHGDE